MATIYEADGSKHNSNDHAPHETVIRRFSQTLAGPDGQQFFEAKRNCGHDYSPTYWTDLIRQEGAHQRANND